MRKLERNYRSTQNILDASGAVIARNVERRGKALWTDAGAGDPLRLFFAADQEDEARWVVRQVGELGANGFEFGDMAVLVRTNAQTRAIEDQMLRSEVPYCLVAGVRFYERAEVKDLAAYLRVINNPRDNLSFAADPEPAAAGHRPPDRGVPAGPGGEDGPFPLGRDPARPAAGAAGAQPPCGR